MNALERGRGKEVLFQVTALLIILLLPTDLSASVLLLYDDTSQASQIDQAGISLALSEAGIAHDVLDLATESLASSDLSDHAVVVACHVDLAAMPTARQMFEDWTVAGGGLLLTGRSGFALEALAGLDSLGAVSGDAYSDVRFETEHPATTGLHWDGEITASPPMPLQEVPAIVRHDYFSDNWPAHAAVPADALILGRWRNIFDDWDISAGLPAVTAHEPGQGRVIYSGALPGVHADWDWPRSWRILVVTAVEWLSYRQPLVELGWWPHAHRGAFAWTGDTEMPEMVTAVPALLDVFSNHGLTRFGTFYVVGRSGGDAGTKGAQEHPGVVHAILQAGSEVGGHGDIHTSFNGVPEAEQVTRIGHMLDILDPLLASHGEQVRGFRAPYLSQDENTWTALVDEGLQYDAGEADTWSRVTVPHPTGDILQLPPTMPMDWTLLDDYQLSMVDAEAIWLDKFDYVMARRGLFSWVHHPWVVESYLGMVDNVLSEAIARGDVWMARQDDIATWWQRREQIVLTPDSSRPGGIDVTVHNPGSEPVAGVSVWVRVGEDDHGPWAASIDGQAATLLEREHGGALFRVAVVPEVAAGGDSQVRFVTRDAIFSDRMEAGVPEP